MKKIFLIVICSILLLSTLSAMEWDNSKNYDKNTRTANIENFFGLGKDIAQVKLLSPISVKVAPGYNQVAEFQVKGFKDHDDFIKQLEFYDLNDDWNEINRKYDLKIKTTERVLVDDYNRTIKIGSHYENKIVWTNLEDYDLKKGDVLTIGIFTEVLIGDKIDWVPTLAGVKINEWASWTASMDVGFTNYYPLNESAGVGVDIKGGNNLNSIFAYQGVEGKLGKAINFDGANDYVTPTSAYQFASDEAFSISMWYKGNDTTTPTYSSPIFGWNNPDFYAQFGLMGGKVNYVHYSGGWIYDIISTTNVADNQWHHIVLINYVNETADLYIDGNLENRNSSAITTGHYLYFERFMEGYNSVWAGGVIDEIGFWNVSLSNESVYNLYNGGDALFPGQVAPDNPPIVNSVSPENNSNYTISPQSIDFICYGSDDVNFTEMEFYLNGSLTQTNSSGLNNTNYTFTEILTDGYYNWSCTGNDNNSQQTNSETRYLTIDSQAPTIDLISPNETFNNLKQGQTLYLAGFINDTTLDKCWYDYNNTNTTFSCTSQNLFNESITQLNYSQTYLSVYANDTIGNQNGKRLEWSYKIFEKNVTFNNETTEGNFENFYLYLYKGAGIDVQSVVLNYNGTKYTTSLFSSGNSVTAMYELLVPGVDTDTNKSFHFEVTLNDATQINTSTETQLVRNVDLDDCSAESNLVLTINLLEEENQTYIINGSIEVNLVVINPLDYLQVLNFTANYSNTNNKSFCSNILLNETDFLFTGEIKYWADNYEAEFYNFQRSNLTQYPKTLNLYDLRSDDSTKFKIIYQGQDLLGVEGAVIQLLRKYISEGVYKIVEAPLTSSDSTTIVHIDTNTNLYNANVVKNGVLLNQFENLAFICQSELTGECTLDLIDYIVPPTSISIDSIQDFAYSINTSIGNKKITLDYSVPTGTTSTIQVLAIQTDIVGNETICNTSVSSAGGSIECEYEDSIQDSFIDYYVYKDGVQLIQKSYVVQDDLRDDFGGDNYFILIIFTISLVFMAIASPEWIIINAIISILVGGATWLIRGMDFVLGIGAVAWLLLAGTIIIIKMSRQEDR